ncbi:DUF2087 domain-containing protein [Thioclava sp. FR2]|uniref:DUF2087 domain-containing protein n=1 Tax=Thioclava sp. FR2 TaxID=3445780 RepID=UPI003EB96C11
MTRDLISLSVSDLSTFAKTLLLELEQQAKPPGHVALMNMLARAAGFRNLQHLRAGQTREKVEQVAPVADAALVEVMLRCFDKEGRLIRWPAKTHLQHLAVRVLWARIPARAVMDERAFSAALNQWHTFGDAPILRRTMVELGLITRSADCRDYCRVEAPPIPEARAVISILAQRLPAVA